MKQDPLTMSESLDALVEDEALFGPQGACPSLLERGALDRVLVVTGENAGGKSIACRALSQWASEGSDLEVMLVGMGKRTEGGIVRGMMFGDEGRESTGNVSVDVALTGIRTARGRVSPHWLLLDEPDVGLGEGYHRALGLAFAEFATDLPDMTKGFVVVSHARGVIGPLVDAGASSLRVGGDLRPVAEWLRDGDLQRSVDDLMGLGKLAGERNRAIRTLMSDRRSPSPSR